MVDSEAADAEDTVEATEDMEVTVEDMAGFMEDMDLVDGVGDILILTTAGITISVDWDTPASVVTAVEAVESILPLP